jgi:BASS family bile acid:Na+ symporter
MLVFMVSNMLAFGMRLSPREVIRPFRDIKLTLKAFIANFVIVPLAAYLLARLFHPGPSYALGIILLATSGGDPGVTKASQIANGDPAYTLATMIGLQVVTVFYMPLMLPRLLLGVTVDPVKIASPLVLFLLLPLCVGFFIHGRWSGFARKFWAPLDKFSSVVLVLAIGLFISIHFDQMRGALEWRLLFTCVAFVAIAFLSGFALGGPHKIRRSDLALQTLLRGISAAMVVGLTNFPNDPDLIIGIILCAVTIILAALIASLAWRRVSNATDGAAARRGEEHTVLDNGRVQTS